MTEKLCFGCGEPTIVETTSYCGDAELWSGEKMYTEGDRVKGYKVYIKDTGQVVAPSLYGSVKQLMDVNGNPVLDEDGREVYLIEQRLAGKPIKVQVTIAETGECWEFKGYFGKPAVAMPAVVPGTEIGNRFW